MLVLTCACVVATALILHLVRNMLQCVGIVARRSMGHCGLTSSGGKLATHYVCVSSLLAVTYIWGGGVARDQPQHASYLTHATTPPITLFIVYSKIYIFFFMIYIEKNV